MGGRDGVLVCLFQVAMQQVIEVHLHGVLYRDIQYILMHRCVIWYTETIVHSLVQCMSICSVRFYIHYI